MNVRTATNRIQQILGFRDDMEEEARQALVEAQETLENGHVGILPWFLLNIVELTVVGGTNYVFLPGDFLREYEHSLSPLVVEGFGRAKRVAFFPESGRGGPVGPGYYIDSNDRIVLNATPETDLKLHFLYYQKDSEIVNQESENNWMKYASRLMIGVAGGLLSGIQDTGAQDKFAELESSGTTALIQADAQYRISRKPEMGLDKYMSTDGESGYRYNDFDLGV